jgi:hypothetical protein
MMMTKFMRQEGPQKLSLPLNFKKRLFSGDNFGERLSYSHLVLVVQSFSVIIRQ